MRLFVQIPRCRSCLDCFIGPGWRRFHGRRFRALALSLFLSITVPCWAGNTHRSVRTVRQLSPEQAREKQPVLLRGKVLVVSGWKNSFFFQDQTAGISVNRASPLPKVKPGMVVEVRGVTDAGTFAPSINAQAVRILKQGKLPHPRLFSASELAWGAQDSQWVAVRGVVRSAEMKPVWGKMILLVGVDIGAGDPVVVYVHSSEGADYKKLIGSTVTVQGACATIYNNRRQFLGLRMFIDTLKDMPVNRKAPDDPFDVPSRTIGTILRFDGASGAMIQVKIKGTVTWSRSRRGFYLQDGTQGVFVETKDVSPVAVGSQVTVVGYPAVARDSPTLHAFVFRVEGNAPPESSLHSAAEMISQHDGLVFAPFESMLVDLRGKLIDSTPGLQDTTLLVQDNQTIFRARLPNGTKDPDLQIGSILQLRGVCVTGSDDTHTPNSFELMLRSIADVTVVKGAPWWNAQRSLWIVGALATILAGMLAWVAFQRRQADLRAMVVTDPLTGLYNRRGFLLLAQKQLELSLRRNGQLLLFYIDLNRFKAINDQYGHRHGDLALKRIAAVLRETFRESDILGRLGGDEFSALATDAEKDSSHALEERLNTTLLHHNELAGEPSDLSLSIGVLLCDKTMCANTAIEDLLERADALMYEQKRKSKCSNDEMAMVPMATERLDTALP